ncbi:diguanylate phosphodiesterase [Enterobacter sp. Bisph1]|uniref:diguanylate phosphodiesterase n=1 Tax=Enterobacter sp. Bisph1 TaxID=1274399 RepID=UPI00057BD2B2|nr:diguanylate phosphodiesterase [Enterobacter sp. Bisph1]
MLTTIIYRSHLHEHVSLKMLEEMVAAANIKNGQASVTGILLFNGTHFFQLLEGPEERVDAIYQAICADTRHYNLVELLRDYAPLRRFGKTGMELFDLRNYDREAVLQTVFDKGTTRYQLTYGDRALQFFQTFVEDGAKEYYYEIPPADAWEFVVEGTAVALPSAVFDTPSDYRFAFQPIVDPFAREIVAVEALLRTRDGGSAQTWFEQQGGEDIYRADLHSKKVAFAMAAALKIGPQTLSVNLLPMTLIKVANAVEFIVQAIKENGLVPEQVIVEFVESEVISHLAEFTQAVKLLKGAGIRVAIDHFGEGYGGLVLLTQFQPDRIKINRALIADVHKSGSRQAVVQAIIKCCISLEIAISAVGIEKAEEWMWLESAGISQFQGYLFARPDLQGIPPVAWPEKRDERV